jgi:hypothetical protein
MFKSQSLLEHLLRGAIGLGALVSAWFVAANHPWLSLGGVLMGLVALRGCPSCWVLGLLETLASGAPSAGACVDGSCTRQSIGSQVGTRARK